MLTYQKEALRARQQADAIKRRLAAVWRRRKVLSDKPDALKTTLSYLKARANGREAIESEENSVVADQLNDSVSGALPESNDDDERYVDTLIADVAPLPALDTAIAGLQAALDEVEAKLASYDRAAATLREQAEHCFEPLSRVPYRLTAVCVHSGVPSSGHYWAHVRRRQSLREQETAGGEEKGDEKNAMSDVGVDGRVITSQRASCAWTRFNDRRVKVVNSEEVRDYNKKKSL